jgi:hypothetical protein
VSAYQNNSQYTGAGESNYHGLHVTYLERPKDWSSIRVSYALSKSMNRPRRGVLQLAFGSLRT